MEFYTRALGVLFREYSQQLKCGDREQAKALRRDASNMLLNCSKIYYYEMAMYTRKDEYTIYYQLLFHSVAYSKFSVSSDTANLMGYKAIIDVCTNSIEELKNLQKRRHFEKPVDLNSCSYNKFPERCSNIFGVGDDYLKQFKSIQENELIILYSNVHQVSFC